MKIVTTYTSRPNSNVGKIVAKCNGKQKSTTVDQSKSSDWNHGTAAANLILNYNKDNYAFIGEQLVSTVLDGMDKGMARHTTNDSGTVHTFEV